MRNLSLAAIVSVLLSQPAAGQYPSWAEAAIFRLQDVEISLRHPAGVGDFPGYTVTIRGDGSVAYLDRAHGQARQRILPVTVPREMLYSLLDRFLQIQYFDLPAEYNGGATAVPVPQNPLKPPADTFRIGRHHTTLDGTFIELSVRIAQREKTVKVWNGEGPPELQGIAKRIAELSGTEKSP